MVSLSNPGRWSNHQSVLRDLRVKEQKLAQVVAWGVGEDAAWVVAGVRDAAEDGVWEVADGVGVDLRWQYNKSRIEYPIGDIGDNQN